MIYLITDSTAYLTQEEANALGVLVVPMAFIKDGREGFSESFAGDWQPGESDNLSGYSTAQAPVHAFMDLFSRIRQQGHQGLCLTISSRLSGTYANAQKAAQECGDSIQVVDSRTTGGAMYLLLRAARQMLNDGHSLTECAQRLTALRQRTHTIFTIQDMDPLRRSGRLGVVRSGVSTLLNLRPLLTLKDGAVVSHSLARGRQDQWRQMLLGLSGHPKEVVLQHCGDEEGVKVLSERLAEKGIAVNLRQVGIVLAIHLGVPLLSLAWLEA